MVLSKYQQLALLSVKHYRNLNKETIYNSKISHKVTRLKKKKHFKKREIKNHYGEVHKTLLKNDFWGVLFCYLSGEGFDSDS